MLEFSLNPRACELLEANFAGPIKAVSVVGLYRTGKSFLLNQLIGAGPESEGGNQFKRPKSPQKPLSRFQTCDTVNSCTKGLWMWSEPVAELAS